MEGQDFKFYYANNDSKFDKDFMELNKSWGDKNIRLVIISPKVTVGCNCGQEGIFDEIFIYATPLSVVIRVILQMMARIRNQNPTWYIYIFLILIDHVKN